MLQKEKKRITGILSSNKYITLHFQAALFSLKCILSMQFNIILLKIVPAFVLQMFLSFSVMESSGSWLAELDTQRRGPVKSHCVCDSWLSDVLKLMNLPGAALRLRKLFGWHWPWNYGFLTAKPSSCASTIFLLANLQYLIWMNITSFFEMFSSFGACDSLLSGFSPMCLFTDYSIFFPSFTASSHLQHTRTWLSSSLFLI